LSEKGFEFIKLKTLEFLKRVDYFLQVLYYLSSLVEITITKVDN